MYNIICSEDKKTIAVVKVTERTSSHLINYILLDEQLNQISENTFEIPRGKNFGILSEFKIDNLGNIAFLSSSYSDRVVIYLIRRNENSLMAFDVGIKNIGLINARLEINNQKRTYQIFSFYLPQASNHVSGIISETWSLDSQKILSVYNTTFSNALRKEACNSCNTAEALDQFFIQNIFLQKNGGVLVESENIYNGSLSQLAYQQFYNTSPYLRFDDATGTSWPFNNRSSQNTTDKNILLIFYDSLGKCDTIEVIPKSQKNNSYEDLSGSLAVNTGNAIELIYNVKQRGSNYNVERTSVLSNKKIVFHPSLKDSISKYKFYCRFGKQVSANEVILPGIYEKQLVFGKIDNIDSE